MNPEPVVEIMHGRRERLLTPRFMVLWLCGWTNFLAVGAIAPLLPRYVKGRLGYGNLMVGVTVAMLAVSAVAVRPRVGRLSDRKGRRFVVTAGALVTMLSFALYGIPTLLTLWPARLLTGIGQALFFTGAATMVTELAPASRRGEAVSYFSVAAFLGQGVGPAIGEAIAHHGTRIPHGFIAAVVLESVAVVVSLFVSETAPTHVVTGATARSGLYRPAVLPGFVLALGILSNNAFASFMPLYADQLRMTGSASVYLTYTSVVILVRVFGARVPDTLGANRCGVIATVLIAAGMSSIAATGTTHGLYAGAAVLAAGVSFLYPSLMILVVDRTPERQRSSAVATFTMFLDVAAGLGGLGMGLVAAAAGYRAAFGATALSAVSSLFLLVLAVLPAARRTPVEG